METRHHRPNSPRPPITWRKFFHRGIVFWLLLWLVSVCSLQTIWVNTKSGRNVALYLGDGAASFCPDGHKLLTHKMIEWEHEEIWSPDRWKLMRDYQTDSMGRPNGYPDPWKLIREYPEILVAKLGSLGMIQRDHSTQFSFPIAGFLWLWLAGGLYGEMKRLKHPASMPEMSPAPIVVSHKRFAVLGGAMLALTAIIAIADRMSRQAEDARSCAGQIDVIEWETDGIAVGKPVPWGQIFGDEGNVDPKYRDCPTGVPYLLFPVKPTEGNCVAQCPREDHRRYRVGSSFSN